MKKNLDPSRRKTLKTLGLSSSLGAAGLSQNWVTPMVKTVVLPTHARATGVTGNFADEGVVLNLTQQDPSLLDMLIARAHAWSYETANVCMDIVNSVANIFVYANPPAGNVFGKLNVPVPFSNVILEFESECKLMIDGQFQEVDGETWVVGDIIAGIGGCPSPTPGTRIAYAARPTGSGCGLTITPPPPGP